MNPVRKIKEWFLLRKVRQEEKKKLPTQEQIDAEQRKFLEETTELKTMITKQKSKRKIYKPSRKTAKKR